MGFFISAFLVAVILVSELYATRTYNKRIDPAPLHPSAHRRRK